MHTLRVEQYHESSQAGRLRLTAAFSGGSWVRSSQPRSRVRVRLVLASCLASRELPELPIRYMRVPASRVSLKLAPELLTPESADCSRGCITEGRACDCLQCCVRLREGLLLQATSQLGSQKRAATVNSLVGIWRSGTAPGMKDLPTWAFLGTWPLASIASGTLCTRFLLLRKDRSV